MGIFSNKRLVCKNLGTNWLMQSVLETFYQNFDRKIRRVHLKKSDECRAFQLVDDRSLSSIIIILKKSTRNKNRAEKSEHIMGIEFHYRNK